MTTNLERLSEAMRAWARPYADASQNVELDDAFLAKVRELRAGIREEEGGGGMCHVVTEILEIEHGLQRLSVSYLDGDGDIIISGHLVSILKDGTIYDPTADQIGEGHDMRILRIDDPEYGRYRPEFFQDYHPGHPDVDDDSLDGWKEFYTGQEDGDRENDIIAERGHGWWMEDKSHMIAYRQEQLRLSGGQDEYCARLIEELEAAQSRPCLT